MDEQKQEVDFSSWHMRKVFFAGEKSPFQQVAVKDPPNYGYAWVWVLIGNKTSIIFSPTTLQSWVVKNNCYELFRSKPYDYVKETAKRILNGNWKLFQGLNWQRDYDTCAKIMKFLDMEIPESALIKDNDDKFKGGKDPEEVPFAPVKRENKKGVILNWIMTHKDNVASMRELCAVLDVDKHKVVNQLWELAKKHGIGYELYGDKVEILLPEGVKDPFIGD